MYSDQKCNNITDYLIRTLEALVQSFSEASLHIKEIATVSRSVSECYIDIHMFHHTICLLSQSLVQGF